MNARLDPIKNALWKIHEVTHDAIDSYKLNDIGALAQDLNAITHEVGAVVKQLREMLKMEE